MKKIITLIAAVILIVAVTGGLSAFFSYQNLNSAPEQSSTTTFTVNKGESLRKVAYNLKEAGIIKNSDFFVALSYLLKKKSVLSGTYTIHSGSTSREVLTKLSRGEIETVTVTIPEGFNIYDISERLEASGICPAHEFLYYIQDRDFLDSVGITARTGEGYLFPETYAFAKESDTRDVILFFYKTMITELKALDYESRLPESMNLHQLLIIASLVEKEAKVKTEQKRVASVFLNRVKRGMRFDSDPTVRYAVKKFKGRIRYKDLDSNSPWNTYRHNGYPPTPIASPGRGAIEAVLAPEESSFLYFVARNDGSHYFSKTLTRHNAAVNYYQKGIKNGFIDDQR